MSLVWKTLVLGVAVGLALVGGLWERIERDVRLARVVGRLIYRHLTREVD